MLYLTDRLPKPNYSSSAKKQKDEEERLRRKTFEHGNAMLPEMGGKKSG